MRPYLDLMRHVLDHGTQKHDRTGTGTLSLFGLQTRYDLRKGHMHACRQSFVKAALANHATTKSAGRNTEVSFTVGGTYRMTGTINAQGQVEFSGDFYLLKPVDMKKGNGKLLLDVPNRGRKVAIEMFNSTPRVPDPTTEKDFGNGFLMRQGYAVAWVGWQVDVPRQDGLMALDAPRAPGISGFVRCRLRPKTTTPSGTS